MVIETSPINSPFVKLGYDMLFVLGTAVGGTGVSGLDIGLRTGGITLGSRFQFFALASFAVGSPPFRTISEVLRRLK